MNITSKLALLSALGLPMASQAATISWATSVDMYQGSTVETFVSTNGTLAAALNGTTDTANAPTVNGVAFTNAVVAAKVTGTNGSITIDDGTANGNAFGDGDFSSNGNIFHLLQGGIYNVKTVTLSDLQVGWTYEVQAFNHDGRTSRHDQFVTGYDGSAAAPSGTSQLSNYNNGTASGARVGDSIIGTFTANSATQVINIFGSNNGGTSWATGNSQSQINGIQLRYTAVPEPSSTLLGGVALLGLLRRRR